MLRKRCFTNKHQPAGALLRNKTTVSILKLYFHPHFLNDFSTVWIHRVAIITIPSFLNYLFFCSFFMKLSLFLFLLYETISFSVSSLWNYLLFCSFFMKLSLFLFLLYKTISIAIPSSWNYLFFYIFFLKLSFLYSFFIKLSLLNSFFMK